MQDVHQSQGQTRFHWALSSHMDIQDDNSDHRHLCVLGQVSTHKYVKVFANVRTCGNTRASEKGRNSALVPVRRSFWSFFIRVRIVQTPVRSYKLTRERFF